MHIPTYTHTRMWLRETTQSSLAKYIYMVRIRPLVCMFVLLLF